MREDIDGGKAGGRIRPAQQVGGAELRDHTRVRREAHAANRRQAHCHSIAMPTLFGVEV